MSMRLDAERLHQHSAFNLHLGARPLETAWHQHSARRVRKVPQPYCHDMTAPLLSSLRLSSGLRRTVGRTVARHRAFSSAASSSSQVPVIDMAAYSKARAASEPPPAALVEEVAVACEQWGFFQVVNHGLDAGLRARAEEQQRLFFALPRDVKQGLRRTADNSRGWYDDELTKQRRDWKEGLDFGSTPHWPHWTPADDDATNGTLDGFNRFPPEALLPEFKPTMRSYYDGLCDVAARLTSLFSLGLGMPSRHFEPALAAHTSYLRLKIDRWIDG